MTNLKTNLITLIALVSFTLISFTLNAQLYVVKEQVDNNGNTIVENGAVGIGTDKPTAKLEVAGDVIIGSNIPENSDATLFVGKGRTGTGWSRIQLIPDGSKGAIGTFFSGITATGPNAGKQLTSVQHTGDGDFTLRSYQSTSNFKFINQDGGPKTRFIIKPNGYIGIGTEDPTETLEVNGNANIRGIKPVANQKNNSYLSIGRYNPRRRADKIGEAAIKLYSPEYNGDISDDDILSHVKPLVSLSATNYGVSSIAHNGTGHFQIRTWNPASEIRFVTHKTGQQPWVKMVIKSGEGFVGIRTSTPTAQLEVNGNAKKPGGGEWATTSDKRTKKNINQYGAGLEEVMKLNPVTFNYNGKAGITDTEKSHIGLIAQEFAKVAPYAVDKFDYTEEGSNKTEEYMSMDASSVKYMLVNAVKEQQALIEAQKTALETLKTEVAELKANGASISSLGANEINVLIEGNGTESVLLTQNIPNPFTTTTRIEYFIPANSRNARMSFRDMTGKEIKRVDIAEEGIGAIELTAKDLAKGIYSYVLYTDGKIVASKKMIIK